MTREERDNAITILENEKKCVNRANKNDYCNRDCYNCELVKTDTEILTALDMAIQALEQSMPTMVYPQVDGITPTVVAQADGEYILKSEAIRVASGYCHPSNIAKELEKLPTVVIPSAEPKTGHWIEEEIFDGDVAYRCSECNELFWIESGTPKDNEYNFCPKCGKRLVEPQEGSEE